MIKQWYYRDFKQHVANKKYKLLRDDYRFIERCIYSMPETEQRSVMRRYLEEWNTMVAGQEKTPPNQNSGRLRANLFLLNYCAKR